MQQTMTLKERTPALPVNSTRVTANTTNTYSQDNTSYCEQQHARAWGGCPNYYNGCSCPQCESAENHQRTTLRLPQQVVA